MYTLIKCVLHHAWLATHMTLSWLVKCNKEIIYQLATLNSNPSNATVNWRPYYHLK